MDVSIVGAWGDIGRQTAISLVQNRVLIRVLAFSSSVGAAVSRSGL